MPRHEKQVAHQLHWLGVEHFLPLYDEVRAWADRRMRVRLPLFPGYLFVKVNHLEKRKVVELSGVIGFVGIGTSPTPLDELEIVRLRRGLMELCGMPHPFLKVGECVRIQSGPFAGAQGVLVRQAGTSRVVICMDVIQQAVAVEIDISCLKPI